MTAQAAATAVCVARGTNRESHKYSDHDPQTPHNPTRNDQGRAARGLVSRRLWAYRALGCRSSASV